MFFRKPLITALALVVGLLTVASTGASMNASHTMYVTFNRPVGLPGVTLGAGTYIFEVPDITGDHSRVRVLSRDRSTLFLMALTLPVNRPAGMKRDQVISFGEASPKEAPPIAVWWPEDSFGRQFIYPK